MKLFFYLFLLLPVFSFTGPQNVNFKSGTFGVYHNGKSGKPIFELKLNEDFTFSYIKTSDPKKPISTSGNWFISGNKIHLKDYNSEFPINEVWKLEKDLKCIKSVKGLELTRLCDC